MTEITLADIAAIKTPEEGRATALALYNQIVKLKSAISYYVEREGTKEGAE